MPPGHDCAPSAGAIRAAADDLASAGIAATIQHDDLHGGNILVGPDGDRIFDWGDAAVAHPFATLRGTFNSIAHQTGRDGGDPAFARLLDVYLEAWTDVLPRPALVALSALALDLACIGKALAWERASVGLEADEMDEFGDSVAGWLVELRRPSRRSSLGRAPYSMTRFAGRSAGTG